VPQLEKTKSAPFAKGSIIWEKKGPLPVWAWALILLGLVLAVAMWRRNKNDAAATETTTGDSAPLPGNQSAGPIFIVPSAATPAVNITNTVPHAPPGAGRPTPPSNPPPTGFRDTGPQWTDALELHWDPVPGAAGYVIKDQGGTLQSVGPVTGAMRTGLVHNGTYFLQIATRNAAGLLGPYSAPITSHTKN
jgi:hypothetical protein